MKQPRPRRDRVAERASDAAVGNPQALRTSFVSGAFGSAMVGFTHEWVTPFLLLIGGTTRHVGFLNALPNVCAALIQIQSAEITEWISSRRRVVRMAFFIQAVVLSLVVLLALRRGGQVWGFIALVMLFAGIGAVANPAWGSWLSDLVKPEKRGDYFGWRNRVLGFMTVAAAFVAGLILQAFKRIDPYVGFAVVFGLGCVSRLMSWHAVRPIHEPALHVRPQDRFTLAQFLGKLHESNFARFVVFVSLMNFAACLASPYFAVLMLRELHFSYTLYSFLTVTATLMIFGTQYRWGRHADKVGNLKIIMLVAPLIGLIPLLWVISVNPLYLFFAQLFSGFVWAGFNLCTANYIYDAVTPEKRTRCIAYFNVLNGVALAAGALAGALLLRFLPPIRGRQIFTLFLISSLLRLAIGFFLPRMLREVRRVEPVRSEQLFFSMIGVRAMLGVDRKTLRI